jgi:DNA polymerase
MTLALDERRLAMLEQFGIRLPASAACHAEPNTASSDLVQEDTGLRVEPATTVAKVSAIELAPRTTGVELMEWDALADAVAACRACKLCSTRRNTVFGVGDRQADWLIVGEAPGENEDIQGEPFVGQAGKLLDNMLRALGLSRREKVYIANVLKCRPPGNRNPEPEEVSQCEPFLRRQVQLLQPKIIVAMGRFAVQSLLGTTEAIGKLRGRQHSYAGVPVVVTYHPAYLLRTLPDKAKAWADLCLAREIAASQG